MPGERLLNKSTDGWKTTTRLFSKTKDNKPELVVLPMADFFDLLMGRHDGSKTGE